MTYYCDECGGKIALCTNYCERYFDPDQEPFNSGELEELEEIEVKDGIMVVANICIDCKKVHDAHIDESFNPRKTMMDRKSSQNGNKTSEEKE